MKWRYFFSSIAIIAGLPWLILADVPTTMSFQGLLTEPGTGNPFNGTADMRFRICANSTCTGPAPLWQEVQSGVVVTAGVYNVLLGSVTPIPASAFTTSATRFFEQTVSIDDAIFEPGEILIPRQPFASVGYAFQASNAQNLGGSPPSFFLDTSGSTQTKTGALNVLGNVGIGETFPLSRLHVEGPNQTFGNFQNLFIRTSSPSGLNVGGGIGFGGRFSAAGGTTGFAAIAGRKENSTDGNAAGYLGFATNDGAGAILEKVRITSDGNVGIGTTSPTQKLDVEGFLRVAGSNRLMLGGPFSAEYLYNPDGTSLRIHVGNDDRIAIGNNGNVGIGTTNPSQKLEVDLGNIFVQGTGSFDTSGDNATLFLGDINHFIQSTFGTGVTIGTFGVPDGISLQQASGNVGIGTTSPGSTLHVDSPGSSSPISAMTVDVQTFGTPSNAQASHYFRVRDIGAGTTPFLIRGDGNLQIDADLVLGDGAGDDLFMQTGNRIFVQGGTTSLTIGGANLDLFLGDSSPDDVFVPGGLFVTGTKNFVQNHPYKKDLSIVYTALEGDEAGTYTRGSAQLVNGVALVPLSDTFAWVTNPDLGLTAQVTPRGGWADLYVESISTEELVVRSRDSQVQNAAFDYLVSGLRIGYEEFSVLQEKRMEATIPTEASYERHYAQHSDRRAYNALERFKQMNENVWGSAASNSNASAALRQAIGQHNPDVDLNGSGPHEEPLDFGTTPGGQSGAEAIPTLLGTGEPTGGTQDDPSSSGGISEENLGAGIEILPMDAQGNVYARSFRPLSPEMATSVPVSEPVELGDVLVADRNNPGLMRPGLMEGDPAVVGVVSGEPGLILGGGGVDRVVGAGDTSEAEAEASELGGETQGHMPQTQVPVAFSGIVLCKVDADYGSIEVGDLLTASPTPGHAMRAEPVIVNGTEMYRPGTILGKALEPLDVGTGLIQVLITLD